jgi:hypothetical protein
MQDNRSFKHIVIGGMQRSGTSLLRAVVGSHTKTSIYQMELPFWTHWSLVHNGKDLSFDKAALILDEILGHFTVTDIAVKFSRELLLKELKALGSKIQVAQIYQVFLEYYRYLHQSEFVGLKTPRNELHADEIFKAFPNTKFLHIIRNPLDQAVSISNAKQKFWGGKQNHFQNIYDWETSVEAAKRNKEKYGQNYMALTYEDLVTNHEQVLPEMCAFLGVDYEPEMILGKGQPGWKGSNSSVEAGPRQGLSSKAIGRYKTALTEKEQGVYHQLLGPLLARYNYCSDDELIPVATGLRLRYSISKTYQKLKWRLAKRLKNGVFFKGIQAVKRMLGMSHKNFLESKKAQAAKSRN